MKALVSGIVHRKGTAKATGQEYDFTRLLTLRPVEPLLSDRMTVRGHGYQEVEVAADPACLPQFAGLKFPCEVDLVTDARPGRFGQLELVVTGINGK